MNYFSKNQWVTIFGIWTLVALFFAINTYLNVPDDDYHKDLVKLILFNIPTWYLWALITPFVIILIDKFPLLTSKWFKHLLIHAAAGLALLFVLSNYRVILSSLYWNYFELTEVTLVEYFAYFRNRFVNDLPFYVILLTVLSAWRSNYFRQNQALISAEVEIKNSQLEKELKEAQLMALRLQLSPHFLFNSLHTISSLIEKGSKTEAVTMTSKLGEFLRRALAYEKQSLITLEQELEFFELYIDIEKERFKDRLHVSIDVDEDAKQVVIPNLLLQPLIENAFKHGISKKFEAKNITLKAVLSGERVLVELYNDGPVLDKSLTDTSKQIGIANVEKRLSQVYDDDYEFSIQNSENEEGVEVRLNLPVKIKLQ